MPPNAMRIASTYSRSYRSPKHSRVMRRGPRCVKEQSERFLSCLSSESGRLRAIAVDREVEAESVAEEVPKRHAWNKGLEMDENVKNKIRAALKGRVPWNKGRQMSEATREKMRSAKMDRKHSLASRHKMSIAHIGKKHSAKTMKKLSQKLTGLSKSAEHRKKISASQKRRHAANRALKDIEEAYKESEGLSRTRCRQTTANTHFTSDFHQKINGKQRKGEKTRAEVLIRYKAMLREYRRLQSELLPWIKAFETENGRRPHLSDVEATQMTSLMMTFKQYLLMRDRLLRDIPFLRTAMAAAPEITPEMDAPDIERRLVIGQEPEMTQNNVTTGTHVPLPSSPMSKMERVETLASSPLSPGRVKRAMSAAMQYKITRSHSSHADKQKCSLQLENDSKRSPVPAKTMVALPSLQLIKEDDSVPIEKTAA